MVGRQNLGVLLSCITSSSILKYKSGIWRYADYYDEIKQILWYILLSCITEEHSSHEEFSSVCFSFIHTNCRWLCLRVSSLGTCSQPSVRPSVPPGVFQTACQKNGKPVTKNIFLFRQWRHRGAQNNYRMTRRRRNCTIQKCFSKRGKSEKLIDFYFEN
jgi:hypothetical protein